MREAQWDQARELASSTFAPLQKERVALKESCERVLAEDVRALCDLPAYATSSMDGWAINGASPWKIIGEVNTGKAPIAVLGRSECMKISTGGVLPTGATAVIPWESATEESGQVLGEIQLGENIRPAGAECIKGDLLFVAGVRLAPPMMGLLAATGHDQIDVYKKIRVAIFYLGDELLHVGVPQDGSIRDALGPVLPSMLERSGAEVVTARFVKDDLEILKADISKVLDDADLIMTTGGTADGPKDFVKPAIAHLHGSYVIDCVKVRPGYHVLIAAIRNGDRSIPFIALPGNPQSAIAAFTSFAKPVISSMLGLAMPDVTTIELQENFKTQEGFSRLVPGNLDGKVFTPTGYLGSAMLRGLSSASGFALISPGGESARWLSLTE
jgi:molybdopterin molybdotransferase